MGLIRPAPEDRGNLRLAVTREGIPVRIWTWPGNTNDQTVITQVRADLRAWRLGRVVILVLPRAYRGFSPPAVRPAAPSFPGRRAGSVGGTGKLPGAQPNEGRLR
ncbi:hypothetical protein GCM10010430_74560 [Kitasatospora cystarginea]|uniref:Transposase n=1 Tax=Kitasatospora cystarginea TaxID=58350 RepID=A0ABN3EZG8_9ACTN